MYENVLKISKLFFFDRVTMYLKLVASLFFLWLKQSADREPSRRSFCPPPGKKPNGNLPNRRTSILSDEITGRNKLARKIAFLPGKTCFGVPRSSRLPTWLFYCLWTLFRLQVIPCFTWYFFVQMSNLSTTVSSFVFLFFSSSAYQVMNIRVKTRVNI